MQPSRQALLGAPHRYVVSADCALGQPLLDAEAQVAFLTLFEALRYTFDLRIYGYALRPTGYALVLQHPEQLPESDDDLLQRWRALGVGRAAPLAGSLLRERFTSLSGFMQTLAQRFSRVWHRSHGGRGSIWASRFRACLLADDTALLAAVASIEHDADDHGEHSRDRHHPGSLPVLSPLPLRQAPDRSALPADEAPFAVLPPGLDEIAAVFTRFTHQLDEDDIVLHRQALQKSWALGRPESLTGVLARLGRSGGRGRTRRLQELGDSLGLCGVWG